MIYKRSERACDVCKSIYIRTGSRHLTCSPKCYIESHIKIEEGENPCWTWIGKGHRTNFDMKNIQEAAFCGIHESVSRFSYMSFKGSIPQGMCVCHTCDRPICVNPAHLKLGTNQDNVDDKMFKGRLAPHLGTKNPSAKLTDAAVLEIFKATGTMREIAEDYGVATGTIKDIKKGRTWWHLTGIKRGRKPLPVRLKSPLDDNP